MGFSSWSNLRPRRRSSGSSTCTTFPAPWRVAAAALAWRYALLASASRLCSLPHLLSLPSDLTSSLFLSRRSWAWLCV
jgi:hypothetical protein